MPTPRLRTRRRIAAAAAVSTLAAISALAGGCSSSSPASPAANGKIVAVGAENEYADVISQIGGPYVAVSAIMSNPNTDPHTFEASPQVAGEVAGRADRAERRGLRRLHEHHREGRRRTPPARSSTCRRLLGLPDSTPNPHLWYKPATMPAVAAAIAADLEALDPRTRPPTSPPTWPLRQPPWAPGTPPSPR